MLLKLSVTLLVLVYVFPGHMSDRRAGRPSARSKRLRIRVPYLLPTNRWDFDRLFDGNGTVNYLRRGGIQWMTPDGTVYTLDYLAHNTSFYANITHNVGSVQTTPLLSRTENATDSNVDYILNDIYKHDRMSSLQIKRSSYEFRSSDLNETSLKPQTHTERGSRDFVNGEAEWTSKTVEHRITYSEDNTGFRASIISTFTQRTANGSCRVTREFTHQGQFLKHTEHCTQDSKNPGCFLSKVTSYSSDGHVMDTWDGEGCTDAGVLSIGLHDTGCASGSTGVGCADKLGIIAKPKPTPRPGPPTGRD